MKRRKAIPNSENMFIASIPGSTLRKEGPAIIPEMIYPIISGCLSSLMKNETARTTRIIKLIWLNTSTIFPFYIALKEFLI
jgi:hypothetical protein